MARSPNEKGLGTTSLDEEQLAFSGRQCYTHKHTETAGMDSVVISAVDPSVHIVKKDDKLLESREDDEKRPLLDGVDAKKPGHRNWRNIIIAAILWLAYVFVSAAYSIIGPFFPNEAADKGSTPSVTGVIVSSSPLCVVLLSPFLGYYLPQIGLRFMLLAGLFLVGGAFVLIGFVASLPSGWVFIVFCVLLRMTEGTGSAMFITATFSLLPQFFPNSVGMIMGLMEVGGGLGFAIGPPIGGLLYAVGGFKLPFVVVGAICLAFVPPVFLLVKSSSCTQKTLAWRTLTKLLTNFIIILLVVANILSLAALSFFVPTLQPFLTSQFNLGEEHIGLVFFAGPVVYMLSSLVVGRISDKFGPRYLIVVGLMISGVGYFLVGPADFITHPILWVTIVAFGVIGVGASLGMVPNYSDMLEIAKSMDAGDPDALTGVISGITSSALSFGEFLGPLIGGGLTEVMDFQTGSVLFGEVFLAEGFLLLGATLISKYCKSC